MSTSSKLDRMVLNMLVDSSTEFACGCLLLCAVACGASERSPADSSSTGTSSGTAGLAGTAAATGGGSASEEEVTDGSESCTRLRASGTFAGEPLHGSNGWVAHGIWTSPLPWRGSYGWQYHALELRGPADGAPVEFVEGAVLTATYGYMVRASALPWQVACLAPQSTVRMLNANDVLDLKLAVASACGAQAGTDEIDLCFASPPVTSTEPEPPCAGGVSGTLGGQPAPTEPSRGWSSQGDTEATTIQFGSYVVRIPLEDWQPSSTGELDFSGGLLAVERAGAFDLYCANAGRAREYELTLSGVSKLVTCDAGATAVESAQVCNWDFTREL